ncbi:hypothetical protein CVD28_00720 [Bacillus sp. M6-12]|uniref:hypothetical protein n=1 Tax=Bacillus sp. M6-12 TaxID=2054166 RepID=UPI000C759506|nr:hypothetical protein [Bacillus sp. M6-12]PLS18956.1 hypothetical protein CVD28_00720 [Bacillus sp. M6-12]
MNEKKKFYQKTWFIMMVMFSPLFPIGIFLMWREKGVHVGFKIFFTFMYLYAIYYTFQTQDINLNQILDPKQEQVEQKEEKKVEEKQVNESNLSKDNTTIVGFVDKYEDTFGEFKKMTAVEGYNQEIYDAVYEVKTIVGTFMFYLDKGKITLVTDTQNQEIKGISYE